MLLIQELFEFFSLIRDLFAAYRKYKDDAWFRDLLIVRDQINKAQTSEEKLNAAREVARLINGL